MRTHSGRILLVSLAVALGVAIAAPAFGAQATPPKAGPGVIDVQVWPNAEPNRDVTVISLTLPDSAKLPVTVRVPIPPDYQVLWAGEILGGDPSRDPARKYTVVNGVGGTAAEFVMQKARTAQVEAVGGQVVRKGDTYSIESPWVQSVASKVTGISVRMPAGAAEVSITPKPTGPPDRNSTGEALYPLVSKPFKLGEVTTVAASWTLIPVANQTTSQQPGATNPIPIMVGLLAAAVVALAVILFWQRSRKAGDLSEDEGEDEGDLDVEDDVDDDDNDAFADEDDDTEAEPAEDESDAEDTAGDDEDFHVDE